MQHAAELGFGPELTLYPVPNTVDALIQAHESAQPGAAYMAWKASSLPYAFLGNNYEMAHHLERKSAIRQQLPAELFPAFCIVPVRDVPKTPYQTLCEAVGSKNLVCQVDYSTGGKGTYFVSDAVSFEAVRESLIASDQDIVVSKQVLGESRAIQCVIANSGVYRMGWWHSDLVAIPGVYNSNVANATKYCGAVLQNIPADSLLPVEALVEQVGAVLQDAGYHGVFGMDVVVEAGTGKIFLIEINPRFTAVSHLYATAMHAAGYQSDFITTTVLESIGQEDEYVKEYSTRKPLPATYYYLKLQNTHEQPVMLDASCRLGVYEEAEYKRFGFGVDALRGEPEVVVIPEGDMNSAYAPGSRLFSVIGTGEALQGNRLVPKTQLMIDSLKRHFER